MHESRTVGFRALLRACVLLVPAGCAVPIAAGLDDPEANRVVVALERAHVEASKEPDPGAEGKWRVDVSREAVPQALAVLRDEELPRIPPAGVLDAIGKGSLVPSEAAEHAQLLAGMAGDLERSLEAVDGVLRARVHLNVPQASPLRDVPVPHASASVLLEHRGSTAPLSVESVQRLIAGGVAGLAPADVAVITVPRPMPSMAAGNDLRRLGLVGFGRASVHTLQVVLVSLTAAVALLSGVTLVLYGRLSRLRAVSESPPRPGRPAS